MTHSVGYSDLAERGRVQRRDLYLFPDFPTSLLTNAEIVTVTVASKLPNVLEGSKLFHVLCTLKHYCSYHEICSYQRSHIKAFPLKLHFIALKMLSHLQEKTPRERVLDWLPLKEHY